MLLTASCATAGGCSAPRAPAFAVSDSAGVRIATSEAPAWSTGARWRVAEEPSVELGSPLGDDTDPLADVAGAARFADGGIIVCNAADRTLRYYASDGSYRGSAAGEGGGPGELRTMARCLRRNGEMWAYQGPVRPIAVYDSAGGFVGTVPMPRPNGRAARLLDIYPDGSLLLQQDDPLRGLAVGTSVLEATLSRHRPGGTTSVLGRFPAGERVRGDRLAFPRAFTPELAALSWDGGTLVSWPEGVPRLDVLDGGRIVRSIRWAREPAAVTAADRAAYRRRILDGPMPVGDIQFGSQDVRRAIVDMMTYPETLPAHYRVTADRTGHLWVERGDAPRDPLPQLTDPYPRSTTWDVLSPDGEWLGAVELPASFDPLEIGADYVLGVHADELGVEQVRMYALDRPR